MSVDWNNGETKNHEKICRFNVVVAVVHKKCLLKSIAAISTPYDIHIYLKNQGKNLTKCALKPTRQKNLMN